MTTITNYLHSNFLSKEFNELQRPFLVVKGKADSAETIWSYIVKKNSQAKYCLGQSRSLIVLDFGVRSCADTIEEQVIVDGVKVKTVSKELKQYLLTIDAQSRRNSETYKKVIESIEQLVKKNDITNSLLIIQGLLSLQLFLPQSLIFSLFSNLYSLSKSISQVNVLIPPTLHPQTISFIQKMGSCLLDLSSSQANQPISCQMVIRRYTGYFIKEFYTIAISNGYLKAQKRQKKVESKDLNQEEYKDMGFSLLKSEAAKEQEREMRKIIFPYLNVQDGGKCGSGGCGCGSGNGGCGSGGCGKCGEEFIVLDDEQEDEDDVDV